MIRNFIYQVHLWLGLITGVVMFVVCLMGAVWVFNEEITEWVHPVPRVTETGGQVLSPSVLVKQAEKEMQGGKASGVKFTRGKAATVALQGEAFSHQVYIHPYTGEVLKVSSREKDGYGFFEIVLYGHRFLWLPWQIGRPIVNYCTLIYVITLITGLFLWWPRTKRAVKSAVRFIWKKGAGLKRVLYDLHNVLGFYAFIFLLVIGLTGMVWGIEWFSDGVYKLTSGGREMTPWRAAASDTLNRNQTDPLHAVDQVFTLVSGKHPSAETILISLPDPATGHSAIDLYVYPEAGKYYNIDNYSFDRYSLQEIRLNDPYHGQYARLSGADKVRRLNYDIHTGSIGGLPGKILVFLTALIGASLPVTGTWLYVKKLMEKRKNRVRMREWL